MTLARESMGGPREKSYLRCIWKTKQGVSRGKKTEPALLTEGTAYAKNKRGIRECNLFEDTRN